MADDSRKAGTAGPSTTDLSSEPEAPAAVSRGIILGKDGKPCRPCMSFAAFASQSKASLKGRVAAPTAQLRECPADVETLGRSAWTLLHSIAATYPPAPTDREQSDVKSFMGLFAKLYPCWVCAEDFQQYIKREGVRAKSRDELGNWLCEAHNHVNQKLDKPTFPCDKWEERWRTGWKDGSCD